jgi:hypothetical protein
MKYAISPDPNQFMLWGSEMIHFEGIAGGRKRISSANRVGDGDYWTCQSLGLAFGSQRRRYFLGAVAVDQFPRRSLQQLALAAEVGLTPCCYGENKSLTTDQIMVSTKNTLYKVPRKVPDAVFWDRQERLDSIPNDPERLAQLCLERIPDPRRRRLYGLQI